VVHYSEVEATDEVFFDVFGITANGAQQLLKSNLIQDTDLSDIMVDDYPYLKIVFKPADPTFLSAAQLNKWLVIYEPVAEGLLFFKGVPHTQTLSEGQVWNGNYSFVNISDKVFSDSLTVKYDIVNPETFHSIRSVTRIHAPLPGDTTRFVLPVNTLSQAGLNNIEVIVNPHLLPEQRYDNNLITLHQYLKVLTDSLAPALDVTFDGRHIQKDEFISGSPDIRIMIWDDNPYLLKKDTTGVTIFLGLCDIDKCDLKRVYFSRSDITWKAETDSTEFQVDFKPLNLQEGTYLLRVEATDAHGNTSGSEPYTMTFKISRQSAVNVLAPYPNPFNYKTNFVVEIQGDKTASAFSLQIMSLNGNVVQTFTERDIADLHTGTNIISWPAVDQDGNLLPNGIYFFRFAIKLDDKLISKTGKLILTR
jgi:hypothetical protein